MYVGECTNWEIAGARRRSDGAGVQPSGKLTCNDRYSWTRFALTLKTKAHSEILARHRCIERRPFPARLPVDHF
ncbi:hypothetical protein EC9_27160 [Rosistilla ulvae]|uniref:Uncharacterized protein n=1 Tax=Rosistilla ulvae TaxID=1930277 RepID=A0A517M0X8_9BACT|nr:hypothetical protein EC9_27160 [Rosistilla ulvae]